MYRGKAECNILKKIRHQIATENGIYYEISECDFQGDCKGTCPKCESELKYLEHQLIQKKKLGKSVLVAGLSAGIITTLLSCQQKPKEVLAAPMVTSDSVKVDTIQNVADTLSEPTIILPAFDGLFVMGEFVIDSTEYQNVDTSRKIQEIEPIEEESSPFPGDTLFINE